MNNERKAYYGFLAKYGLQGLLWLGAIIGLYMLANYLLPENWNNILSPVTDSTPLTFLVFFLSETIIGIVPAEFFVIWAKTGNSLEVDVLLVLALAIVSYIAGIVAFFAGKWSRRMPLFQSYLERPSAQEYLNLYRRWGGVVIAVAALTPLPFGFFSLISGAFEFPFKRYVVYALFRFVRFLVVGYVVWVAV